MPQPIPSSFYQVNAQRNDIPIEYAFIKTLNFASLPIAILSSASKMPESAFSGNNWSLVVSLEQVILSKLKANSISLEDYAHGKIRRGILTGFNEAFIIDQVTRDKLIEEDPKSAEVIKPFLVGEDVKSYSIDFQGRYLIWTYIGIPINRYPAIYRHLQQYQAQLEKRWDKGNYWWELRHCDYYADFEGPKILYPEIAMSSRFAFDEDGYYTNNKAFLIPKNDKYLLAILNSSTSFLFFQSELSYQPAF